METAEHREPYESRDSPTGARGAGIRAGRIQGQGYRTGLNEIIAAPDHDVLGVPVVSNDAETRVLQQTGVLIDGGVVVAIPIRGKQPD